MSSMNVLWVCLVLITAVKGTTEDGETINKFTDTVNQLFNSSVWLEFKDGVKELYEEVKTNGWYKVYNDIVKEVFDPMGKQNAFRVLGLTENASQQDIRRRYKELAIKWHPDKNHDNKDSAQKKFMEIQKAYEILSYTKSKRASKRTEL